MKDCFIFIDCDLYRLKGLVIRLFFYGICNQFSEATNLSKEITLIIFDKLTALSDFFILFSG